jgi:hypothetical protein
MEAGPEFVTKEISCKCSCTEFYMRTVARAEKVGFLRKRTIVRHAAPFYLSCAACQRMALLFDPAIHGWNGQMPGATATQIADDSLSLIADRGNVFVNYSYQSPENYEELVEGGIENGEDYFDTFTVYFRPKGQRDLEEIGSYECA